MTRTQARARARARSRARDGGSVTVHVLVLVSALTAMALAGAVVGGLLIGQRRAASAADLAALAAAAALQRPVTPTAADPCGRAREVAAANGARLERCAATGEEVRVIVAVDVMTVVGETWTIAGRARAGPVGA
jgi:secretion/DNA translocation related TadE-like protein